jgi:hypothetical protein
MSRLPAKKELVRLFMAVAFPIHAWSILMYLRRVPAYQGRMDTATMVGVFAYAQAFALIETAIVTVIVILLALSLPKVFRKRSWTTQGTALTLVAFIWMLPTHYSIRQRIMQFLPGIVVQSMVIFIWLLSFAGAAIRSQALLRSNVRLNARFGALIDRLLPLSAFYLLLDAASILLVLFRNIGRII